MQIFLTIFLFPCAKKQYLKYTKKNLRVQEQTFYPRRFQEQHMFLLFSFLYLPCKFCFFHNLGPLTNRGGTYSGDMYAIISAYPTFLYSLFLPLPLPAFQPEISSILLLLTIYFYQTVTFKCTTRIRTQNLKI